MRTNHASRSGEAISGSVPTSGQVRRMSRFRCLLVFVAIAVRGPRVLPYFMCYLTLFTVRYM